MDYTIRWVKAVHGVCHAEISLNEGKAWGMEIPVPGSDLRMVMIRASRGYLMCGIANIEVCRKVHDAAAIVYAQNLGEMLKNPVASLTEEARQAGICEGMCGLEALRRLL